GRPEGGLLGYPRLRAVEKPRRPVAAQVRNQRPITGRGERSRHAVPRTRVVREPVEQDDGDTVGVTVRLVADLQRRRPHPENFGHRTTPLGHRLRSYVNRVTPCRSRSSRPDFPAGPGPTAL